ncbi:MAG TPA: alpha/beta hydrolase, partial [Candidatus Saccharimonadales bacterium]|nr:alpha/beta hydrolase [Candidatus Saccharimonadales bacterium]
MFTNYQTLDLENGTIEYVRSGKGKTLLFAHGLLVNANLWYETVKRLQGNYDCVVLNLPFGAHRLPMPATADLSPPGLASMVSESISRLHLKDVTLISNDSGDVLAQLLATSHPEQVARLVMTNGDAFENFLPIRYRYMQILSRLPGSLWLANRALHWRAMQRLPLTFGPTSKRPIPPQHIDDYLRYARASKGVRRDLQMVL